MNFSKENAVKGGVVIAAVVAVCGLGVWGYRKLKATKVLVDPVESTPAQVVVDPYEADELAEYETIDLATKQGDSVLTMDLAEDHQNVSTFTAVLCKHYSIDLMDNHLVVRDVIVVGKGEVKEIVLVPKPGSDFYTGEFKFQLTNKINITAAGTDGEVILSNTANDFVEGELVQRVCEDLELKLDKNEAVVSCVGKDLYRFKVLPDCTTHRGNVLVRVYREEPDLEFVENEGITAAVSIQPEVELHYDPEDLIEDMRVLKTIDSKVASELSKEMSECNSKLVPHFHTFTRHFSQMANQNNGRLNNKERARIKAQFVESWVYWAKRDFVCDPMDAISHGKTVVRSRSKRDQGAGL